jgi:hypothetical protein
VALARAVAAVRRFLAHVRFVLGAALVGAAAGLALALISLPPANEGFPSSPTLARWVLALAPGFGIGWWLGLLWGVVLSMAGRGAAAPAGERRAMTATFLAAGVLVLAFAVARVTHVSTAAGLAVGAVAAVAVAFWWAGRGSRGSAP